MNAKRKEHEKAVSVRLGRAVLHTDGPPSNDLAISPCRTMSLPQILAGLTNDALARWPGDLTEPSGRRGAKLEVERLPRTPPQLPSVVHGIFHGISCRNGSNVLIFNRSFL